MTREQLDAEWDRLIRQRRELGKSIEHVIIAMVVAATLGPLVAIALLWLFA